MEIIFEDTCGMFYIVLTYSILFKICFCNRKMYRNLTWFPDVDIPRNCGNYAFPQNFHDMKSSQITIIYPVDESKNDFPVQFSHLQDSQPLKILREEVLI